MTHARPRNLLSTNKSITDIDRAPLRRALTPVRFRGGARGALARRSSSSRVLLERTHDSRGGTGDAISDSGERERSAGSVIGNAGANRCATGKIGVANGNIACNACGALCCGRGPLGGSNGLGEGGFNRIRDDDGLWCTNTSQIGTTTTKKGSQGKSKVNTTHVKVVVEVNFLHFRGIPHVKASATLLVADNGLPNSPLSVG